MTKLPAAENVARPAISLTLPSSKIVVLISARYHERAPDDPRLALTPDVPVEVSWADYAAGRDLVLAAALKP